MSLALVEPEPEHSPEPASRPMLLRLLALAGWTVDVRPVGAAVAVTASRNGRAVRRVAATAGETAVPIFQEAMRHRDRT